MYCTNCGVQFDDESRFCSGCGKDLSAIPPPPSKRHDWNLHINVLAWLIIAHAVTVAGLGLMVMVAGRVAGRLMHESPDLFPPDMPPDMIHIVAPAAFLIGVAFLFISVPSILAGVGLLYHRAWGRGLTLVMSFVRLLEFPFGTVTAVYSFWVLLSKGGKEFYRNQLNQN